MKSLAGRRPSPAMVVASLALFVALGGTSYAAARALLPKNSVGTAQVINGSLQKSDLSKRTVAALRGRRGPQGPMGLGGARGPTGQRGVAGEPWTLGNGVLPSGKTLRGVFAPGATAADVDSFAQESISFGFTTAGFPTVHYVPVGVTAPPECPGSKTQPEAAPGHLCLYEAHIGNVAAICVFNPITNACGEAAVRGFGVAITAAAAGEFGVQGSWAVTAP